jgi:hypothetical protein
MSIMAKQASNSVNTIKLPGGQHTQAGRETLKEQFTVHFPDSKATDDSSDGKGQQNMSVYRGTMNRGGWNMAKQ